jgi:hypothetical protein
VWHLFLIPTWVGVGPVGWVTWHSGQVMWRRYGGHVDRTLASDVAFIAWLEEKQSTKHLYAYKR